MPDSGVVIREESDDFVACLEVELLSALRASFEQGTNASIVLSAREEGGTVIGGLAAGTSHGWLLVKILWICERHRRRGIGRQLMERAETAARELDCYGAWLDTSSPAAKRFYRNLGFEVFGELSNPPGGPLAGHRRFFMRKSLRGNGR